MDKILQGERFEPAATEWAVPVVFAPKKNGSHRFCIDYCKVNAVPISDWYQLPRIDARIESPGCGRIFSILDVTSEYCKIKIDRRDLEKTKFTSHHGLLKLVRMPSRMNNPLTTSQRAMDVILPYVKWQSALIYLDDIVFSQKPSRNI